MKTIRKEVQAFVRASEILLSPVTLGQPLNEDERGMVAMYAQDLAKKYPAMEVSDKETPTISEPARVETEAVLNQSHQVTKDSWIVIDRARKNIQHSRADVVKMKERIKESRQNL